MRRDRASAAALLVWFAARAFGQTPVITEYPIPTAASNPNGIAAGSDGELWFAEGEANKIGRIATDGSITEYAIPAAGFGGGSPGDIAAGPDGALWFGEVANIGQITTGGAITQYQTDPGPQGGSITTGPDGALWYTERSVWRVGRITTSGAYTSPYSQPDAIFNGIATGPDGNLWVAVGGAPPDFTTIKKISTAGTVIAEYTSSSTPQYITAGPDGALWFTEGNSIGRMTTTGQLSEFAIPTASSGPSHIIAGPDGALWFTEFTGNKIGRITTGGTITEYAVPTTVANGSCSASGGVPTSSGPLGIAAGPDGAIWFTESCGNQIGRLQLPGGAPSINAAGVVNSASFATPPLLAPGTIVSIFGSNLTDGSSCVPPACSTQFEDGALINTMAGVQVSFNGIPAPIFFAVPLQLGVQIPVGLSGGSATVEVSVSGKGQYTSTVALGTSSPGIFTVGMNGEGAGAITHADAAGTLVSGENPTHAGEAVVIYATGLGQLSPIVPTGALPSAISTAVEPIAVTIGGITAVPEFAGQSGCCVGLDQINVTVPAGVSSGINVPLFLLVAGKPSNTVTLAIE